MSAARLSAAKLETLLQALTERDQRILDDLARLRVLTGQQLTRLHFFDLSPATRDRVRRRVLSRLVSLGAVAVLERRIGGARAGSRGQVYALGLAGQRLAPLLAGEPPPVRARQPWTPGRLFLWHSLDVAELGVQLREHERRGVLTLRRFDTEPASWHGTGYGGVLKPDALAVMSRGDFTDTVWLEVDRDTESLPTLRRKLLGYVDFALSGQLGPGDVVPRVLVTVPTERRRTEVLSLIKSLPEPAEAMLGVALHANAVLVLANSLDML